MSWCVADRGVAIDRTVKSLTDKLPIAAARDDPSAWTMAQIPRHVVLIDRRHSYVDEEVEFSQFRVHVE
jgi:hypothetical protein